MLFVFLSIACALLSLLFFAKRPPANSLPSYRSNFLGADLNTHLSQVAAEPPLRKTGGLRSRSGLIKTLEKDVGFLSAFPDAELLPAAMWLCENGRFLQEKALSAQWEGAGVRGLPVFRNGESRVLTFAREYVGHRRANLTLATLQDSLSAWQSTASFNQRELCLLPLAFKIALLSIVDELCITCTQDQKARLHARHLLHLLHRRNEKQALRVFRKNCHQSAFLERLLSEMPKQEDEASAQWLEIHFAENNISRDKLAKNEHERQTESSLWLSNAITSLHTLDHLNFDRLLENWSVLNEQFSTDETYTRMDAESRAYYRETVYRLSRRLRKPETAVLEAALTLSKNEAPEELLHHVGYYLLDEGRQELIRLLRGGKTVPPSLDTEKHPLYFRIACFGSFALLAALGVAMKLPLLLVFPFSLVMFFALWNAAMWLYKKHSAPKMLPRLKLERLTPETRTLVVCPTMLLDREHALSMVKHLSILHSANPDPQLHFMLLGDYRDSLTATMNDDEEILLTASAAIKALREDTGHEFFYFHRDRIFHTPDHLHMSRERKRGSLETLMRLLAGQSIEDTFAYASCAPEKLKGRYRYIITLDSDTFLPPGAAHRLVGSMLHPLQKRQRLQGKMRGVSVIQPGMEVSARSVGSWLSLLLGGAGGSDPYNRLTSDFYSNFLHSGNFAGKGIIDPAAFLAATDSKIVPGQVLSHDLLEGQLGGCAVSDVLLFDSHPASLKGFLYRHHRWVRGDWQLLCYLLPFYPGITNEIRHALDTLSRHKLWQNLLRSLVNPMRVLLILCFAALGRPWLLLLVLLGTELPSLLPFTGSAALSALTRIAALPLFALMEVDAIARALYRQFVTRENLLKWTTAAQLSNPTDKPPMLFFYLGVGSAAVLAGCSFLSGSLFSALPGYIASGLWLFFPLVNPLLEQSMERNLYPTGYMREVLSNIASETLLYYETSITPTDHGLPPDNVQLEPNKGISHRTSPTNIGLYLVALVAAEKMRLLPAEQLARRVEEAIEALEHMEKWQGHLYNWYNTQTLAPLAPRFVSSVDSGNLAVCLLCCAQGLRVLLPEIPQQFHSLPQRLDTLLSNMDFRPLFDPDAELFHIGFYPEKPEEVQPYYDLFASESRLLSFAAIIMGQVPVRHWYRLMRRYAQTSAGQALLSSGGTMFEYMMPLLFMKPVRGTLMERTLRTVAKLQAGRRLGGAWGVSESGYYAFDPQLYYQYKTFGLPALALKAGIDDRVLSPYASMLTLPIRLKPAFMNLLRLRSMGLEGPLGLFEAADFDPSRRDKGSPFQLVRSHMAHHQGMILITICNVLCRWYIADLFGNLPKVQAYQLLLEEKYVKLKTALRRPLKRRIHTANEDTGRAEREAHPLCLPMDAQLLYGAGTTLMIDAQGGGYLARNGVMLTRFQEECHIPSGMRLYLKDTQSGTAWSLTDPKFSRKPVFETSQAVFRQERLHVDTEMRVFVNPLDGAAIHFITLKNLTQTERMLEICSYLEPALSPLREDNAQPHLHNLFMQSKKLGKYGVAIRKRPVGERQPPTLLWHMLTADIPFHLFRIQTDRTAFLGRGRSIHNPRSLEMPISGFADSVGDMIEPCASLRGQFVLPAQGKVQLGFITLNPTEKDSETAFLSRYDRPESAMRTFHSAETQGHVTAKFLGLSPREQNQVFRLTGCIAYTGQPMQFRFSGQNVLPRKELSSLGLTSDMPILLLECDSPQPLELTKLLLKAHALFRMGGLWFELVILAHTNAENEAETLRIFRETIFASHSSETFRKDCGVHLFSILELPDEQQNLIRACARLVVHTSGGTLAAQLDKMETPLHALAQYQHKPSSAWKAALPSMEPLYHDNEFGGFSMPDGNYVILLPPGRQTPAPWCNPLCSENFGTLAAESGLLFTYSENSQNRRLNHSINDSITPRGEENFFLRDGQNKLIWSLTRFPLAQGLPCRISFAPGEAVYETSGYGIYSRMTCFTDQESSLAIRVIQIKNEDRVERSLTLCHSCTIQPGDLPADAQLNTVERTERGVMINCPALDGAVCLMGTDPVPTYSAAFSSGVFYGLSGNVPYALSIPDPPQADGGNTALNIYSLQLSPGESKTVVTVLGYAVSKARLDRAVSALAGDGATLRLHRVKQSWEQRLSALQFDLPDQSLSLMLNRWLPYQTIAARLMMRSGFYQSGGAKGFRDQLQDMLALIHTEPEAVRDHLLLCASRQYEEGDVQHWWHSDGTGVRTRISDDMLFLPYVAAVYLQITGDLSLLSEPLPYIQSPPLAREETERMETPIPSAIIESFQQHCLKAIDRINFGVHGLPLMGGGDWNDGMNRVGGEKGESIWLGMFLCEVLRRFAPYTDPSTANRFATLRIRLMQALDQTAWDGNWYLRGWYSTGDPLGSADSSECMLTLLPQCWAVFSGLSRERCSMAMNSVWEYLWEPDTSVLKLFTPPFNGLEDPGYIAAYVPGVRENGGQYTHAAVWAMAAWYQLGKYDRAWELALALLPTSHTPTRQTTARYRVEPYVMAADIYSNPRHRGRGGWTWYTGSAAWYQYLMLTELLGFRKVGNTLRFRPILPPGWDWVRITYRFGSATYHLHGRRDCPFPMADGEKLKEGCIILRDDGKIHEGVFPIRG